MLTSEFTGGAAYNRAAIPSARVEVATAFTNHILSISNDTDEAVFIPTGVPIVARLPPRAMDSPTKINYSDFTWDLS